MTNNNNKTKEMPWDFWNHNVNPILGYKYEKPIWGNRTRDKFEYPKEDDYSPNED